ncbi:hypothetical protein D9756_000636 [Leucocoprinus leucothites]|uniref:C2H2-type domain-containing protein n=1 Tax=Leucocoprinus leucothites TaxID=201217 RepID=A0A8H5GGE1_9AGAR|nr:hypothetical protein D9756_000636 [Leucoagaricus leucothites]
MSQHSTAQAQYHGSIYYPPTKIRYPILRPVPKTEGTGSRLSHSPPPMQRTIPAIQVKPVSFKEDCSEVRSHCSMQSYSLPPFQQQWSCSDGWTAAASSCPPPSCCGPRPQYYTSHLDATHYMHSVYLPPLKSESVGSRRCSPRSFSSEESDTMSVDELNDEEEAGLPYVLSKFKLDRPQTPGSDYTNSSRPSTQSPEPILSMLPVETKQPPSSIVAPSAQRPITRDTASDRRKVARQIRRSPSPVLRDPVHTAALDDALRGARLADITVPQLRSLIKKLPIPTHLDGKWEEYTVYEIDLKDPKKDHRCTFDHQRCKYIGKKQLVQRHIEGVHLKIRQYKCPYCESAFHQETCAITHVSSIHLKVFPFQCKFCDKCFNDVARRHRHYQEAHGYVSKKTSRASKAKKSEVVPVESPDSP